MNVFEKAELTALIRQIARFLKSGTLLYNSKAQDTAGRKTRRRRTHASTIGKRFAFYASAISHDKI